MHLLRLPLRLLAVGTALTVAFLPEGITGPPTTPTHGFASIPWEGDYDQALERSGTEGRVLFVAVNMDGERANDLMAEETYRDDVIVELAGHSVNVIASTFEHRSGDRPCSRFDGITCKQHRTVDVEVRSRVLEPNPNGYVIAPQHVFLDPKGAVILSVPYVISAAELEWCFYQSLRAVDPTFEWELSKGARAPKRVIMGEVIDGAELTAVDQGLSREEVLELISEVKKGLRGKERNDAITQILRADEPEAAEFITQELRRGASNNGGGGGGRSGGGGAAGRGGGNPTRGKSRMIHRIGVESPASYWEVVAEFAEDPALEVRAEVPVALEQLASPGALKLIRRMLKREKDETILKNWWRALASCGAEDPKVQRDILKALGREKDAKLRANMIASLGHFPVNEDLREDLLGWLGGDAPEDAKAAAIALGWSRDEGALEALKSLLEDPERSTEDDFLEHCRSAVQVIEGGRLRALRSALRASCGDTLDRERFFEDRATAPDAGR